MGKGEVALTMMDIVTWAHVPPGTISKILLNLACRVI